MHVEFYEKADASRKLLATGRRFVCSEESKHGQLAVSLGFNKQITMFEKTTSFPMRDAQTIYPELNEYNLSIFANFLPKRHSFNAGDFRTYSFDVIPVEVLDAIDAAKKLKIFDDIEIWTPEKLQDPLAIGVLGATRRNGAFYDFLMEGVRFFPIARWGESIPQISELEFQLINIKAIGDTPIPKKVQEFMANLFRTGVVLKSGEKVLHDQQHYFVFKNGANPVYRCCGNFMFRIHFGYPHTNYYVCTECGCHKKAPNIFGKTFCIDCL